MNDLVNTAAAAQGADEATEVVTSRNLVALTFILATLAALPVYASERGARRAFDEARHDPVALRQFLYRFPKGGDLHNHLDGAIYAENLVRWAAEDGKCVDLDTHRILPPPCDAERNRPPVATISLNAEIVNELIDAYSTRNYERRRVSGHDQFFGTFYRFFIAGMGREGDMLSEASNRAAEQNVHYLELMQSWGMDKARAAAATGGEIGLDRPMNELLQNEAIDRIATEAIAAVDAAERRLHELQKCGSASARPACDVKIAYLAQVIRTFPREQVLAQTLLAARLIDRDPRFVGLNFVAPEDAPISLRDYRWQMKMIADVTRSLPEDKRKISLHAGELAFGLVPPEDLGWHIREAVDIAGASRIGHGVDIVHDPASGELLSRMASAGVAVEICLTSNADILEISGDDHPLNLYREHRVPVTLATDDEGVSRIDLTHEYQRAVETYDLGYAEIKALARNALEFSFQAGPSLFAKPGGAHFSAPCRREDVRKPPSAAECRQFVEHSEKARLQWNLEEQFAQFEARFR